MVYVHFQSHVSGTRVRSMASSQPNSLYMFIRRYEEAHNDRLLSNLCFLSILSVFLGRLESNSRAKRLAKRKKTWGGAGALLIVQSSLMDLQAPLHS
jgi:hypothetical protein